MFEERASPDVALEERANNSMHRHRYFNLSDVLYPRLHDDKELVSLIKSNVLERVTLHEWPLSCVQRLATSDGRKLIYKSHGCSLSAFGPTVESEFYRMFSIRRTFSIRRKAMSGLLVPGETIHQRMSSIRSDRHVCMLFEFIQGPLLKDLNMSEEQVVRIGRTVMEQIAGITGELPLDVFCPPPTEPNPCEGCKPSQEWLNSYTLGKEHR